jgi:hypothetical protein
MLRGLLGVVAVLCTNFVLGDKVMAATLGEFRVSNTPVTMDHVTIETSTPYPLVKSRLQAEVRQLDGRYRELLKEGKIDELREKLTTGQAPNGSCSITSGCMAIGRRPGIVYFVGNVLSAVQMTKLNFSAALYAPLRLNVYGNA